jgi:DNA-binding beta-propeller fold protein YncE
VVDAVGQIVKVFDISTPEVKLLYSFGELGNSDGEFYYPNDIAIDQLGRLYITDRENNRVQVWSY